MEKRTLPEAPPKARTLEEAQLLIDELWEQLAEKDQQTRQNSKNSSRPPSSDSPALTPSKETVKRSKKSVRSRGAQKGHKGHRRALLPKHEADATHQHYCASHCGCGGVVQRHQAPDYRHQIFDLPDIQYRMEEHQLFHEHCEHCNQLHRVTLPDTVSPTQMGAGLLGLCSILTGQYHLSLGKIKNLMKDVFGFPLALGHGRKLNGKSPRCSPALISPFIMQYVVNMFSMRMKPVISSILKSVGCGMLRANALRISWLTTPVEKGPQTPAEKSRPQCCGCQ